MILTPLLSNLHQLTLPTPFPVGPVNVYLAHGEAEPLTLIDTGPRTAEARAALESGLAELGYTLADVGRIIITHAHADHHGLAGDIAEISGATVYAHPHSRPALEDYAAERASRRAFYEQMLIESGVPPEVRAAITEMTRGYSRFATSAPSVRPLNEGDALTLARCTWQVYAMPGHTGGLLCFYQPEMRLFLSNDHLLRDISSNPLFEPPLPGQTQRRRSLVDYVASLERTAGLDIAVAWPGHGEPVYDHRTLIAQRLAFHRRRGAKILAALDHGRQTVFALSQTLFRRLEPAEYFLAISETLAHLEWLEAQGAVTAQRRDERVFWERKT
jgi:glyoxylase-like metal-dependent hydrolase (beta-lactamase superfamily II)